MWDNSISQEAVSSGFFRSSGTSSSSCFPLEVIKISCPFFSIKNVWNNFSIISALVAIYLTGFSIALSSVASVNLAGGFVLPEVRVARSIVRYSPFLSSERFCPDTEKLCVSLSKSSSQCALLSFSYTAFQPGVRILFPLEEND